jgi:glycerol-3-phosphate acyltransferase PlsY
VHPGLAIIIAFVTGYLAGSIPFGVIISRRAAGIDLRQHGSGNIGATNVARSVGAKWGAVVLLCDALKGFVPTLLFTLAPIDPPGPDVLAPCCGLAAVCGHMFPCWLRFRGGKGVATALGTVAILDPWATLAAFAAFLAATIVTRIVSAGSILAAVTFGVVAVYRLTRDSWTDSASAMLAFAIAVPLLVIAKHHANISRLLRGKEPRFSAKRREPPANADDSSAGGR